MRFKMRQLMSSPQLRHLGDTEGMPEHCGDHTEGCDQCTEAVTSPPNPGPGRPEQTATDLGAHVGLSSPRGLRLDATTLQRMLEKRLAPAPRSPV